MLFVTFASNMSDTETADSNSEQTKLFVQHSNWYDSQKIALQEIITDFRGIVSSPNVSVSSLSLVQNELQAQYDSYIKSWNLYENHILDNSSLYTSASRDYRQLKREAIYLLNQAGQLKDEKTTISQSIPTSSNPTQSLPTPKLKAIEIPKFDGDIAKWSSFWDIYNSLIHCRSDLENVVKFTTLLSHLTGRAFKTVEGISVTNANYESVINLLKKQFGNSDKLITQLTREIQNLSVGRHHYDDLLSFKLAFEKLVLQLENIEPNYTSSQYFLETLISKLPAETFRTLANRYHCTKFTYRQVVDGLSDIIELMEQCKLQPQGSRRNETVSQVTMDAKSQSNPILKTSQKKRFKS